MADWISSAWSSVVSSIYSDENTPKTTPVTPSSSSTSTTDTPSHSKSSVSLPNNKTEHKATEESKELKKEEEDVDDMLPDILMLTLNECFIYKIPPLINSSGYHASDWHLESPLVTGSLRVFKKKDHLYVRMYVVNPAPLLSDEKDKVFGECILEELIECKDSSRYFVMRIMPPNSIDFKDINSNKSKFGKFTGFGFREREIAFDLKNTLQEHTRYLERCEEAELFKHNHDHIDDLSENPDQNNDSGVASIHTIKDGDKISVKNFISPYKSRQKHTSTSTLLPPPPPPTNISSINSQEASKSHVDEDLKDEDEDDEWGDFTSS